jgi:hypothetical protein
MKKKLKLMPDYGCFPLWSEGETTGNIDPCNLPLTQETIADLLDLAAIYDSTLNQDYPQNSGFKSTGEASFFEEKGIKIWHKLRYELALSHEISYFSQLSNKLLINPLDGIQNET